MDKNFFIFISHNVKGAEKIADFINQTTHVWKPAVIFDLLDLFKLKEEEWTVMDSEHLVKCFNDGTDDMQNFSVNHYCTMITITNYKGL
jgi:hypothetical protein